MSKEYKIESDSDNEANRQMTKDPSLKDSLPLSKGNPKNWKTTDTKDISLFWNWFICNHQETIKKYFKKTGIAESEFGVDLEKFKNIDEDEIIRRLKV